MADHVIISTAVAGRILAGRPVRNADLSKLQRALAVATNTHEPQPWEPEANPVNLAVLGKTVEEMGECLAAIGRTIVQGVDGRDPVTGEPNRQRIAEELDDLSAVTGHLRRELDLNLTAPIGRVDRKTRFLGNWLRHVSRLRWVRPVAEAANLDVETRSAAPLATYAHPNCMFTLCPHPHTCRPAGCTEPDNG
jgi:hypothetical protein